MDQYIFRPDGPGELQRLRLLEQYVDPMTQAMLGRFQITPPQNWAEIGIGAGSVAHLLAERLDGGGSVIAYDNDFRNYRLQRPNNLSLAPMDLTTTAIPLGSFDGIHCRFVLLHLPDREKVLRELVAGLKPGGVLIVTESDCSTWKISEHATALGLLRDTYLRYGVQSGWRLDLGATLPDLLLKSGITEIEALTFRTTTSGASLTTQLVRSIFESLADALVATGHIDNAGVQQGLAQLADPSVKMTYVESTICSGIKR